MKNSQSVNSPATENQKLRKVVGNISLIITTYNRDDALELVFLSILHQNWYPAEIIVADDGSSQTTRELIHKYQKKMPILLRHCWHEDQGFRAATIRNKAIVMATNDYIIIIDGDMVLHKDFVNDHIRMARPNVFVQGKRVLLGQHLTQQAIQHHQIKFNFFHSQIKNRLNTLRMPLLANWLWWWHTHPLHGIRSCNMAFWRKDAIFINGFNEEFIGWGREDSEFVARLLHTGIKRFNFKFGATAYHLYHQKLSNPAIVENDRILAKTLQDKKVWCKKGINQYL